MDRPPELWEMNHLNMGPSTPGSFQGSFQGGGEENEALLSPARVTQGNSLSLGVWLGLQLGFASFYMLALALAYAYVAWEKVIWRGGGIALLTPSTALLTTILAVEGVLLRYASSLIRQGVTASFERLSTKRAEKGELSIMLLYDMGSWMTDDLLGAVLGTRWKLVGIRLWSLLVGFVLAAIIKKGLTVGPASQAWTGYLPADSQNFGLGAGQIPGPMAFFNYSTTIPIGSDFTSGASPLITCGAVGSSKVICARVPVQLSGFQSKSLSFSTTASFSNITMVEVTCTPTTATIQNGTTVIVNDDFDVATDIVYDQNSYVITSGYSYYFTTLSRTLQCAISPSKGSASMTLTGVNNLWSASMTEYAADVEMAVQMPPFRIICAMAQLLSDGASMAASRISQTLTGGDLISGGSYDGVLAAIVAVGYTAERTDDPPSGTRAAATGRVEITAIVLDSMWAAVASSALSLAAAVTLFVLLCRQCGIRLVFSPLAIISMVASTVETPEVRNGLSAATAGCCAGGKPQDKTINFRLAVNNGTHESQIGHLGLKLATVPPLDYPELRSGWSSERKRYGYASVTA